MSSVDIGTISRRSLALIIGIGQYQNGANLKTAENDARDMSRKLKDIGFITGEPKTNLTYQEMKTVFNEFQSSAYPGDIILIYFAGHGTQWKVCIYLIVD